MEPVVRSNFYIKSTGEIGGTTITIGYKPGCSIVLDKSTKAGETRYSYLRVDSESSVAS